MTKCSNCGEEIDGPAYSLDSDPDMPLCSHCHKVMKNVPEKEIDLIRKTVRYAQKLKPRCKACYPCPMGVVGCDEDSKPHGHGSAKRCPECGVLYDYVHPHSNVCSLGTPIDNGVIHDEHNVHRQLEWTKDRY